MTSLSIESVNGVTSGGKTHNLSLSSNKIHLPTASSSSTPTTPRRSSPRIEELDQIQYGITKSLFISFCVFMVCVSPYACSLLLPYPRAGVYFAILVALTSCINPILYALRHPQFREVFRPIVRCRFRDIPEPAEFLRNCLH